MDLGFSRRDRNRDPRGADADRLRSLLSEVAMRQSMTATARMQTGAEHAAATVQTGAEIGHFVTVTGFAPSGSAFHSSVAAAIVNDRQDS